MMQLCMSVLCCLLIASSLCAVRACAPSEQLVQFKNTSIYLRISTTDRTQYSILKESRILQTVSLENFYSSSNLELTTDGGYLLTNNNNDTILFDLISTQANFTHVRISRLNVRRNSKPMDCISLNIGHTHWYGGPESRKQFWPVERLKYENYAYLTKEENYAGVSERYWLNSDGVFFYVDENTPLFIYQNSPGHENEICFQAQTVHPYNPRTPRVSFIYHIGFASNARDAHMQAIQNVLGHPKGYPDERMAQHPIWSTWALYKTKISESEIRTFASNIKKYGFENGQLEIDDDWEECYGSLTFDKIKFPNIKRLTGDLKAMGFRITLWVHPFINKNCRAIYDEAKMKGYLVADYFGNTDTKWWNSKANEAAYLDFTKPEVREWFSNRLTRLRNEDGIDSFKFDAGETSWTPTDPSLQGSLSFSPNQITRDYVQTVAEFGPMIEVRTGQGTQELPVFVRMLDKDSFWDWNNGLITLITTLLQINMNGYPFVLPDMIGGNGYNNNLPSKELFIRWLQANVFMPSIQFSYVPWMFDMETINITKRYTELHSQITPYIMERFRLAVSHGDPVNPPLWWADPEDTIAQGIYDQFMLGDDIIAAPVVHKGSTKRDIYLPKGVWKDGNTQQIYMGPTWLMNYDAPLDTLPFFQRINYAMTGKIV